MSWTVGDKRSRSKDIWRDSPEHEQNEAALLEALQKRGLTLTSVPYLWVEQYEFGDMQVPAEQYDAIHIRHEYRKCEPVP